MASARKKANRQAAILTALDNWYRRHARNLPWRIGPAARDQGETPDPYLVWLSEVMLQQTTIPHAAPYFERFRQRWPTVGKLAKAKWEDVSAAWAGLGYYSRARNLHACAQVVAEASGFPQDAAGLAELPGVGPYTAAAIAAIAFDEPAAPVDGNIERVVSRLWAIGSDGTESGWGKAKIEIRERAQALFDGLSATPPPGRGRSEPAKQATGGGRNHRVTRDEMIPTRTLSSSKSDLPFSRGGIRSGDLAQALMDLGATVCTPKKPSCPVCPVARMCAALSEGAAERYPVKPEKRAAPVRYGSAFVLVRGGQVLLVRRPPRGLLGGMMMPPTSAWTATKPADALEAAPAKASWERVGEVRHVFTHFSLKLDVFRAEARARAKTKGEWLGFDDALAALPTVGRKAVALAAGLSRRRGVS